MKKVKIDAIRIDGGTQGRVVIDQSTVQDYVERMKDGAEFPRVFCVFDGTTYWLVDGFHRYHAFKILNLKEVEIDYKPGTLEEAQVLSFGVNAAHGKPRTNEDKRKVVEAALEHPLTKIKSDREIGRICSVSHPFVASVRNAEVKEQQRENDKNHKEGKESGNISTEKNGNISTASGNNSISESGNISTSEPKPNNGANPDEEEIKATELAVQADMEMMYKILESDDALKLVVEENKRLNQLNAQLEVRINGLLDEKNDLIKMIKSLQKENDRLKGKK